MKDLKEDPTYLPEDYVGDDELPSSVNPTLPPSSLHDLLSSSSQLPSHSPSTGFYMDDGTRVDDTLTHLESDGLLVGAELADFTPIIPVFQT
eukprot:TRINITY_DN43181_c0_g2_i1.p1 TRINITY_DN43181_c0_g2~~TRINITY_DN43181_c0_g2_i1.p1  ORF type:complete len:106 (-),score=12.57 TRINITY_DN43181_c0_g2_i1:85-360(-)